MTSKQLIFSVIGARPHFVKAAPFMDAMRASRYRVLTIHSGQHYDPNMSDIFFQELGMPAPDLNLGIGSGSHAYQTAQVLTGIENLISEYVPEAVVVFGDTNTTLGAALAAAKEYVPLVHVEAGVRCGNRKMPEEINRSLIDNMSNFLACPSELAVANLKSEGVTGRIENVGDVMYDTFLKAYEASESNPIDLCAYGVAAGRYMLATLHRESVTASADLLKQILDTLGSFDCPVILPMHPRTRACLTVAGIAIDRSDGLIIIEPVGYIEMINLLRCARLVLTDSGGLQKEAFWAGVPCVTLMNETTWTEIVDVGWSILSGLDPNRILSAVARFETHPPSPLADRAHLYGPRGAAQRLVRSLGWL
jgi:UDP-N-acetylglucosamine 2-epimerase